MKTSSTYLESQKDEKLYSEFIIKIENFKLYLNMKTFKTGNQIFECLNKTIPMQSSVIL